jgi:hypothetical protein
MTDIRTPEAGAIELPENIVYVREMRPEELPEEAKEAAGGAQKLYGIHDPNGARLALTDDRGLAFSLARQHDREPVSVH